MTKRKVLDFGVHAFLPLIAGAFCYRLTAIYGFIPGGAYISDALWAFAFCSSILIVWDRKINLAWLTFGALTAVSFEVMQGLHLIKGTGDVVDVIVYFVFGGIAIISNRFFAVNYNIKADQKIIQSNA